MVRRLRGAGDVNGDGFDDIIIGAFTKDDAATDAGQVYIFFGKETGWSMDTDLSNADASIRGAAIGDSGSSTMNMPMVGLAILLFIVIAVVIISIVLNKMR